MSNNHFTPENSIFINGINVFATYLKCQIRRQFTNEKKRKSIDELFEECEKRILNLEIAHEKKAQLTENEVQGGNVDDTFVSDSNLPGCSTEELFNRVPIENSKWVVDGYMKEGLVNLLVAGGGVGKSILMVQIARAVAKGIRPEFLSSECCASIQLPVVFYRLEDFPGELEGKYGDGSALRNSGIRWFLPKDLLQFDLTGFIDHLKKLAETLKEDTLVCIDPATKLDNYTHTNFINGVEDAMATAKARNITLTVLASIHLDEIKDWTVLTNCDIKGGDKALQQAGSVTALRRERTDVEIFRYLQCLKAPKGSPKPFKGKVLVCKGVEEELDDNNKYLHYEFDNIKPEVLARPEKPKIQTDASKEYSADPKPLKAPNQKVTPEIEWQIRDMLSKKIKPLKIAKTLHLSEKTIRRYKKEFETKATT